MKRTLLAVCAVLVFAFCVSSFADAGPASKVAVIAHEPGYYTTLAKHIQRWLGGHGIASDLTTPAGSGAALQSAKVAFLVGFAEPTDAEVRQIASFVKRGGKVVVFYTASPALADLMGVKVLGYKTAPYAGAWSRMDFDTTSLAGCPRSILQTSTVLQRAVPVKGRGYTMATWLDRKGKTTGDAAWIKTDAGFWMTHVLLADGDEAYKAQLLAAICGFADPSLWSAVKFAAKEREREAALRDFASSQSPRKGEIHAVWDHSGCGLYPGDWKRTIALLKESDVTDLFVNVAGAGFAHYASSVLPRSKTFDQEGDQLAQCIAAAKGSGIRVHAWILCFTGTRSTPDRLEDFRKRGWRLKDRDGKLTEYLDPSNPDLRARLFAAMDEIQSKYAVDGIHLDFVRWYERSVRPKDASSVITRFVAEARRHVKRPRWLTAAVLGKYPACIASVGQDWDSWLSANLVDYVVPMDYTESMPQFESFVAQHAGTPSHARRTIVGIGVTANESRLDAKGVIDQINVSRKHKLAGNALFDLDVTLEKQILPYLRLGCWRKEKAK
jgi:uncharacterized lipoprotein YddW (UPF0748 family)